jgi:hypothetical protein
MEDLTFDNLNLRWTDARFQDVIWNYDSVPYGVLIPDLDTASLITSDPETVIAPTALPETLIVYMVIS